MEIRKHFYIARDSSEMSEINGRTKGRLILFNAKPIRKDGWWDTYTGSMELNNDWFPELKWEDEPMEVEIEPNSKMILLDKNFVWMARDTYSGDNLYIYNYKPRRRGSNFECALNGSFITMDSNDFPEVEKGEDPIQCLLTIKL